MKKLLLAFILLASTSSFAKTYTIKVNSNSADKVSFGFFKGRMVPSLCDDGPCREETDIKFHPLKNAKDIRQATIKLTSKQFSEEQYFLKIGDIQIEFAACEFLDDEQKYFYPPIGSSLDIQNVNRRSYCLDQDLTTIEVNYQILLNASAAGTVLCAGALHAFQTLVTTNRSSETSSQRAKITVEIKQKSECFRLLKVEVNEKTFEALSSLVFNNLRMPRLI